MPLRLKLLAALAAAILILVVGATSYYASREAQAAGQLVDHTDRVRTQLEQTLRSLLDAETGQRGYLLVNDSAYLAPYVGTRTDVDHELATLRVLTADNPVQQRRVDSLSLAADARMASLDETVRLASGGQRDSALRVLRAGGGLAATQRFRRLIAEMEGTEAQLLTQRTQLYADRKRLEMLVVLFGSIAAAVLSVVTVASIRTSVIQLEHAKTTIEEQSEELATQLEESQTLTEELAMSNDELVHANVATDAARARFEQLLESTDEGLYGMDNHGVCTFVNSAGARMLGYERDEMVGHDMHEMIHHRHADGSRYDEVECPIYQSMRSASSVRVADEVFWKKDGTPLAVEYTSSPIVENGAAIGGVVAYNDISARKKSERERERLITALARSNQELDQFAYVASHDLKAPLR
ncbi:MAG TPA: CHASE3 domain-containing protein, partial [Candidatus Elarobacter sp.]|nr:CHASE3 domain-containing protein [Candidatus Elarobacter sp.]